MISFGSSASTGEIFEVGGRCAVDGLALPMRSMVFSLQKPLVGRGITPKVGVDGLPMMLILLVYMVYQKPTYVVCRMMITFKW